MRTLRIPIIFLIIIMRVVVFVTTYNTFWRHVTEPVKLSWAADVVGFIVICFILLYDDFHFERRGPRGLTGATGESGRNLTGLP